MVKKYNEMVECIDYFGDEDYWGQDLNHLIEHLTKLREEHKDKYHHIYISVDERDCDSYYCDCSHGRGASFSLMGVRLETEIERKARLARERKIKADQKRAQEQVKKREVARMKELMAKYKDEV